NTVCESCGLALGYLASRETITALRPDMKFPRPQNAPPPWKALAVSGRRYRYCANFVHGVCNWLVRVDGPDPFCAGCRHNRTIPALCRPQALAHGRMPEAAKPRLFYTLLKLRLPLVTRAEDPRGLAFDFLADGAEPVLTGHDNGLITINLAEADDAERERRRH